MPQTTDALVPASSPPSLSLSPHDILEARGQELAQQTGGVLIGDLYTSKDDAATMNWFGAMVPALDGGVQGILTAIRANGSDYPVWIHATCFPGSLKLPPYHILTPEQMHEEFVAHDAGQFRRLVERVMQSEAQTLAELAAHARHVASLPPDPETDAD